MSNSGADSHPRVLVFGMRCAFSAPPLQALIAAGCDIRGLVLPAAPGSPPVRVRAPGRGGVMRLPVAGMAPGVEDLADRAGIPIIEFADLTSPEAHATLVDFRPDAIVVACFPWRVPAAIRAIPRLGCLNLHPSLLPRWRGPEPLFWTFKAGDAEAGVTVHLMDDGFDTGPILNQWRVPVPAGVDGLAFERQLAALGGRLLVKTIAELAVGRGIPRTQAEALATSARMPDDEDFVIRSDQPAGRIVDLVRGIVPLWGPLLLHIEGAGAEVAVNGVISFEPEGTLPVPAVWSEQTVRVRCQPGVALLTIAPSRHVGGR